MKLPSLQHLANQVTTVLTRFPLTVLSSVLGAIAFTAMSHAKYPHPDWMLKLFITSFLALPLTLSLHLVAERYHFPRWQKILLSGIACALMAWYYLTLPSNFDQFTATRFFLFFIGLHLLVAFCPYSPKSEANSFWQYNKRLFLRILLAALYSLVLYGGMALALLAIDKLFDIRIQSEWYATLAAMVLGVFNTCFFLAGVPHPEDSLENTDAYPKGLLLFTQFVLLPLVTVYLTILYFYSGKILILQTLPKGWVSYLVLGFSIAGILSLLLIHPIRTREGNRWIQTFGRWFYIALFPLIVLLFVAISERLSAYGITENRYFVLLLACWLLSIALYMLLSTQKNIYWIPLTLSVLAFLSSFGPWGAFSVAERSQLNRLDALLRKHKLLQKGKIAGVGKKIPFEEYNHISSLIDFFVERGKGEEILQPYFAPNLTDTLRTLSTYEKERLLLELAQLEYRGKGGELNNRYYFNSYSKPSTMVHVSDYDYMMAINSSNLIADANEKRIDQPVEQDPSTFRSGEDSLAVGLDSSAAQIKIYQHNHLLISLDIRPTLESLSRKHLQDTHEVSEENLSLLAENELCKLRVKLSDLEFSKSDQGFEEISYRADILIGLKKPPKPE
ncbi:MAG: DUF4153 domain-containing protein [Bacteroidota bacterium]